MRAVELSELYPFNDNLFNIHGDIVGSKIAETIVNNPRIRKVYVLGEPGIGKSTILTQIRLAVKILSNGEIPTYFIGMETSMNFTEDITGIPRAQWGKLEYIAMSRNFYEEVQRMESRRAEDELRSIAYMESLSMWGYDRLDRAVFGMGRLTYDQTHQKGGPDALILAVVPDYRSQLKAALVRVDVEQAKDGEAIGLLRNRHRIIIIGVEDTPEGGRVVKAIFHNQARQERMMYVSEKIREAAYSWSTSIENQTLVNNMWIPDSVKTGEIPEELLKIAIVQDPRTLEDIYRRKTGYTEHQMLRGVYELPEDIGMLLHNPFDWNRTVILDITPFLLV